MKTFKGELMLIGDQEYFTVSKETYNAIPETGTFKIEGMDSEYFKTGVLINKTSNNRNIITISEYTRVPDILINRMDLLDFVCAESGLSETVVKEKMKRLNLQDPNFQKVNRVEIVGESGRVYSNSNVSECSQQVQDNGKTLKLFIK